MTYWVAVGTRWVRKFAHARHFCTTLSCCLRAFPDVPENPRRQNYCTFSRFLFFDLTSYSYTYSYKYRPNFLIFSSRGSFQPEFCIKRSLLQNPTREPDLFRGGRRNWKVRAATSGMTRFRHQNHKARKMDTIRRDLVMQLCMSRVNRLVRFRST